MFEKLIHAKKVAERWGVSHRTLERWRCEGYGPLHIKIGGRVMYRPSDIEKFELERLRSSTQKLSERMNPRMDNLQAIGGAA